MYRFQRMVAQNQATFEYCKRIREMNEKKEKPNGSV